MAKLRIILIFIFSVYGPFASTGENLEKNGEHYMERYTGAIEKQMAVLIIEMDSLRETDKTARDSIITEYANAKIVPAACKNTRVIIPDSTFTDKLTIRPGNQTINLIYPGPTHTHGSMMVEFATEKVLATRDVPF